MSTVITYPAVSIPKESGATSKSKTSYTVSDVHPVKIAAYTAAP